MSISQNFPDEGPSLNLNFASSRTLDPRITFTRTSTGTYLSNNGLVTIASANTPRFDHSYNGSNVQSLGLLVEESRTNLITYSEQFDNAAWGKTNAGITTNTSATTAPDGNTTADKLVENSANGTHILSKSAGTISGTYALSCFVKAAGRYKGYIQLFSSGGNAAAFFDLNLGTITTSAGTTTITPYPNDWYRVTASTTFTSASAAVYIVMNDNSGNSTYTGDGTSGIYVWGAQLEAGAFPTSYIPTVASTVTRSADNASMTGTNFSSWYNSSEGTLFAAARINALGGSNYPGIAYVDDGTTDNCIGFYINDAGSDTIGAEAYISNVAQYGLSSSATTANRLNKVISAYKVNDFAATFNVGSNTVQTDTSGSVPTVNRLIIGLLRGSNAPLNGTISQLLYYPKRLSNSQLQNLTK